MAAQQIKGDPNSWHVVDVNTALIWKTQGSSLDRAKSSRDAALYLNAGASVAGTFGLKHISKGMGGIAAIALLNAEALEHEAGSLSVSNSILETIMQHTEVCKQYPLVDFMFDEVVTRTAPTVFEEFK